LFLFSWEPDPAEADPSKGSRNRRKVDVLGMIVGIIGSKDQLVNEYRVMLAEKLLNKSDYDIDSDIRTLELLKASGLFIEACDLFNYVFWLKLTSGVPFVVIKFPTLIFIFVLSSCRYILERAACRNAK
jgi:hypothetical protein